jgi:homoserine dehydrogenase
MRAIHVGVLGLGNVGAGVVHILRDNRETIEARLAARVIVKRVLVRDLDKAREVDVPPALLTTDANEILDDPDIRVVVEVIGGTGKAREWVLAALEAGKHVVTANKALLAEHGREIFGAAAARGAKVYFEGSVAGGIPVLRALREGLASDRIERLVGIVNGTSNYILDSMTRDRTSYAEALAAAQAAGFAEADPTLDVEGGDAAHKLALLVLVSAGVRVDPESIPTEGITTISSFDIESADRLGYVIKSLAIADLDHDDDGGVGPRMRVQPCFVPRSSVLAGVHGSYNAVMVESRALGRSLYYGKGAGMLPTGAAVVSDLVEVCRDLVSFAEEGGPPPQAFATIRDAAPRPLDDLRCENYVRVCVPNVPGVLGRVAGSLGQHGVSIKSMSQSIPTGDAPVQMVIITERAAESAMRGAVERLNAMQMVKEPVQRIRILPAEPID